MSADTDFGAIIASRRETKPSFILIRRTTRRSPPDQVKLLMEVFSLVQNELNSGVIVVIEESRIRTRALPIV